MFMMTMLQLIPSNTKFIRKEPKKSTLPLQFEASIKVSEETKKILE